MKYRKIPIVVDATQWNKNGDHPGDGAAAQLKPFSIEGNLVRRYRDPGTDGHIECKYCEQQFHHHGWIDTLEGGHIVCPGDFVITGVEGEHYPCKPDIFHKTYESEDQILTAVISGFPGVGKTYFKEHTQAMVLDSDSSKFSWLPQDPKSTKPKVRNPEFPGNYIAHIQENMGKVDAIFVSSHQEVREALVEAGMWFLLVYPERGLKKEYLKRFFDRDNDRGFIDMLDENWDTFIDQLDNQDGCDKLLLDSGEFLSDQVTIDNEPEEERPENFVRSEADLVKIGFVHSSQSTAGFTQYDKVVNGVTWSFITRTAGNDYFMKDNDYMDHCETWELVNVFLDEHKLRD